MSELTEAGRVWALGNQGTSIVARVALSGITSSDWPEGHTALATRVCNEEGRKAVALTAFLATYEGPWGLKASEEDALLSILRAVRPDLGLSADSEGIYALRDDPRLVDLSVKMYDLQCEGLDAPAIIDDILPAIDNLQEVTTQ